MNLLKSLDVGGRVPPLLQGLGRAIWPGTTWSVQGSDAVHLTFDDGPDPEVTPWVLDVLAQHGAKATFFVVGDQAARHPDILEAVKAAGHATLADFSEWCFRTATASFRDAHPPCIVPDAGELLKAAGWLGLTARDQHTALLCATLASHK